MNKKSGLDVDKETPKRLVVDKPVRERKQINYQMWLTVVGSN